MFGEYDSRTGWRTMFYEMGEAPARVALEDVQRPDSRVIEFTRDASGEAHVNVVDLRDSRQPLEQRAVYHSPTGLEFGYRGSGPADTALNILLLVVPIKEAARLHQHFKEAHVATVPREGGFLPLTAVREWIAEEYRAELAELNAEAIT